MTNTIGIIGGDLRIIRLAEIYAKDNFIVYTFGLEKYIFSNPNIVKCNTMKEVSFNCKTIISGVPFSKDSNFLETPFSNEKILISNYFDINKNKKIIAGGISKYIEEKNNFNIEVVDILNIEELTILNIIPTVEGAIKVAIEETEFTLNGAKCLILGFGRIGKLLANKLQHFGTVVDVEARKQCDLAWIKAFGYKGIDLKDLDKSLEKNYDIIFNTIPYILLDKKRLELLKETKPLIIELASKPGGVDLETANKLKIRVVNAQGLPGKVAPLTSAENIKRYIKLINK